MQIKITMYKKPLKLMWIKCKFYPKIYTETLLEKQIQSKSLEKKILPEQNRETFPMKMIMFHNLARIQVISKETPSFRNP